MASSSATATAASCGERDEPGEIVDGCRRPRLGFDGLRHAPQRALGRLADRVELVALIERGLGGEPEGAGGVGFGRAGGREQHEADAVCGEFGRPRRRRRTSPGSR